MQALHTWCHGMLEGSHSDGMLRDKPAFPRDHSTRSCALATRVRHIHRCWVVPSSVQQGCSAARRTIDFERPRARQQLSAGFMSAVTGAALMDTCVVLSTFRAAVRTRCDLVLPNKGRHGVLAIASTPTLRPPGVVDACLIRQTIDRDRILDAFKKGVGPISGLR
jgi:hypothetical protein